MWFLSFIMPVLTLISLALFNIPFIIQILSFLHIWNHSLYLLNEKLTYGRMCWMLCWKEERKTGYMFLILFKLCVVWLKRRRHEELSGIGPIMNGAFIIGSIPESSSLLHIEKMTILHPKQMRLDITNNIHLLYLSYYLHVTFSK